MQTNTHIDGTFTVLDVNGNVLSEQKNKITDWGMIRITGYNNQTPKYIMSLADNLRKIWVGSSQIPTKFTDYALYDYLAASSYTETNEPTITGTTYSLINAGTSDEKLKIRFTKGSRFDFLNTNNSQISEVGISSNYQRAYGDYVTTNDEWDAAGTSWPLGTNGHKQKGKGPYGTGWPSPHEDKLETSLFSRALLSSPISVIAGDILIIKYVLEVTTDAHRLIDTSGFTFDASTIDPSIASEMPNRKTSVRRKLFYELKSDNTVTADFNTAGGTIGTLPDNVQGGRAVATWGGGDSPVYYQAHLQFLPFLEVPAWGKNYIAMYDEINVNLYAQLNSNTSLSPIMSANSPNYIGEVVQNQSGTTSFQFPPYGSNPIVSRSLNYLALKERTTFKTLSTGNTITCQHRFLFNPGDWRTIPDGTPSGIAIVKDFCFMRRNWSADWTSYNSHLWNVQPLLADRVNVGMYTCMESKYNPYLYDQALYLGIDYTMTFSRSSLS